MIPIKDTVVLFAGSGSLALAQFVMFVFVARKWGAEAAGDYALAMAICAPVIILTNFSLRSVISTDHDEEVSWNIYWKFKLINSILALCLVALISIWLFGFQSGLHGTVFAVLFLKIADSWSEFHYGFLQRKNELRCISKSILIRAALAVCSFIFVGIMFDSLVAAICAVAIMWFLYMVLFDRLVALSPRRQSGGISKKRVIDVYTRLAALGMSGFVLTLIANLPRYLVEGYGGREALGLFAAITYVIVISNLFVTSMTSALISPLARIAKESPDAVRRRVFKLAIVVFLSGIVCAALVYPVSAKLMVLFFGKEFIVEKGLLSAVIIVATTMGASAVIAAGVMAFREYRLQLAVNIAAAIPLVSLSGFFYMELDVLGIVIAWWLSAFVQLIGYVAYFLSISSAPRAVNGLPVE